MKKVLFAALCCATLLACNKEDMPTPPGGGGGTTHKAAGAIRYTNTSANRYIIYLDGSSLGLVNGKSYYIKSDVPVGSHTVEALQYEGYIAYPTHTSGTANVYDGGEVEFVFP